MMIPHIYNGNGTISLMIDGKMKPVDTAHKFYNEIKTALKEQNWEIIPELVDIKTSVETAINSGCAKGKVLIKDGEVFYNGTLIHNSLTNRIVNMAKEGFDIGHMVKFLENLMANPSYRAVTELYDFLEAGAIPITDKGTFLTYKKITGEWKDIHSGTFDNSIGSVVEMPRNMVNEDSSQTCSAGLHVCSYGYLPNFGWGEDNRVVVCEVNPADVVSIPNDYNNTKMRVCKYTVIGEVKDYKEKDTLSEKSVIFTNDVTHGTVEGMVNHTDAKQIGKDVTNDLMNEVIAVDDIEELCIMAGLDADYAEDIWEFASDGEYKRVGKKIAYYIKNDNMNASTFLSAYEEAKYVDAECSRCGTDLDGMTECSSCGFWN